MAPRPKSPHPYGTIPLGRIVPLVALLAAGGFIYAGLPGSWIAGVAAALAAIAIGVSTFIISWKQDRRRVPAPLRGSLGPAAPPYVKERRRSGAKLGLSLPTGAKDAALANDGQQNSDLVN